VQFLGSDPAAARFSRPASSCASFGLVFGLVIFRQLRAWPSTVDARDLGAHLRDLQDVLVTQGKFILLLEVFIGTVIAIYFGVLGTSSRSRSSSSCSSASSASGGSYGVAWFGIRINTFANSRTAFASSRASPTPCVRDPAQGGHGASACCHQRVSSYMMLCILLLLAT